MYEVQGTILSPVYPENYPNNLNCTWQILAQVGEDVKVVIEEFNLAEGDSLTIIDGNHPIAQLTGRSLPFMRKFRSHTNTVIIMFVSGDSSPGGKGFKLKYSRHLSGQSTLGMLHTLIEQSFFKCPQLNLSRYHSSLHRYHLQ